MSNSAASSEPTSSPSAEAVDNNESSADASGRSLIYLLDVGDAKYGDCILCRFNDTTILIDGSHPGDYNGSPGHASIPAQLEAILGPPPFDIDLLIVTHCHADHIGCLPAMVKLGLLDVRWALVADPNLGWGRSAQDQHNASLLREDADLLAAALREESRADETDASALYEFILDAARLEDNYREMLATIENVGTNVVRYGRDEFDLVEQTFAAIGLKIIGPSLKHLLLCAEVIGRTGRDVRDDISDALGRDDSSDLITAYRALAATTDSTGGIGPALNNQSIVALFEFKGRKFLFTGDMQFAEPEVANLKDEMASLRQAIAQYAPFDLVKIPHHASYNAFNNEVLEEMGATPLYGISTGEKSTVHPNSQTLALLKAHRNDIQWARTDHNRMVTFDFSGAQPSVEVERGILNDWRTNSRDAEVVTPALTPVNTERQQVPQNTSAPVQPAIEVPGIVEVSARVPHTATRVTLTIDVEPRALSAPFKLQAREQAAENDGPLRVGNGRPLPPLLFITSREALARNIGAQETDDVLEAIRRSGCYLNDQIPATASSLLDVVSEVSQQLQHISDVQGVVILGGYDVVPSLRLDAVPSGLRQKLKPQADPDDFVIWSDARYGDRDGDELAELAVSRIPDGRSAALVKTALQAAPRSFAETRSGIRNVQRPFAEGIYQSLAGREKLLVSQPAVATTTNRRPAFCLTGDEIYLMLHGDYRDGSRFWGEGTANDEEAINIANLPSECGGIVFTGCCWGALTVDQPAAQVSSASQLSFKTVGSSLALSFLARGAVAFVGCTGAHYSPIEAPYNYFGGPLHEAFWRNVRLGAKPAQALHDAKKEYVNGIPHIAGGAVVEAIEHKILHQYTCLGLGW